MKKCAWYKDRTGATLVEMLVTFALLGIFLIGASGLLLFGTNMYYHVKAVSLGRQVGDQLMTKLTGTIESALPVSSSGSESKTGSFFLKDKDEKGIYHQLEFYDRTGSGIIVKNKEGYLNITYKQIGEGSKLQSEETEWYYDKNSYMGYQIENLEFSRPGDKEPDQYQPNVIKIRLKLNNQMFGDYTTTQYVTCYNFETAEDMMHFMEE